MDLKGKKQGGVAAKESAARFYKSGKNCAQSVLLAMAETRGVNVSDEVLAASVGLGGGLAGAGCVCGALNGASMIIGLAHTTGAGRHRKAIESTSRFHERFKNEFGATCCRALRSGINDSDRLIERCTEITATTAQLLDAHLFSSDSADDSLS